MNRPKGQKLEGLILVGESNRRLWRKGVEALVYYLFHGYSLDVELFVSRSYIHVVEYVPEECIFYPSESTACKRAVMQPTHGMKA